MYSWSASRDQNGVARARPHQGGGYSLTAVWRLQVVLPPLQAAVNQTLFNLIDDGLGILFIRIVGGDDEEIAPPRRDAGQGRTVVAIAACVAKHGKHPPWHLFP